jgi:quercetin dioxygenase-like cupin family protein
MNRRDAVVAMGGILSMTGVGEAGAQQKPTAGTGDLVASKVFLPVGPTVKTMPNGSSRWEALNGTLATGEALSLHVSTVPTGTPGAPLHRIEHSELIVVIAGTLEFLHGDAVERAPAGSVIYVAYGTLHAVRNAGEGEARYAVLQMGGDTTKP